MTSEHDERLSTELELLQSIYPDQITFTTKGRELTYTCEAGNLKLRLPDDYPKASLPEVISASAGKQDLRDQIRQQVQQNETGLEILDAIINDFIEICNAANNNASEPTTCTTASKSNNAHQDSDDDKTTIIIYLHHLLNTNKRKLALHPTTGSSTSASISGITKPGYPGVLLYSGPTKDVREHVDELRSQNWQAFQSRLEVHVEWEFTHGRGVVEVQGMRDVVAGIVGEERKEEFLGAMRMK